ncbi:MAG: polymer-forming cytoskeletal protein [Novosphingobium sp.]|nr:polymer-forming cytoskeletal protein [Novosphingobium sp.]
MFGSKTSETPRPAPVRGTSGAGTFSILGADTAIRGDISATADLHIDGAVEGDIACAALVQGESSSITGAIRAESARLAGHLKGSIAARELVILRTARIEGDVTYEALTIEQGARVDGRFAPVGADAAADDSSEAHLTLASSNPSA